MGKDRKIYAVIGDPVAHSLSPPMHNRAFQSLGMDAEYLAVEVKNEELANFAEEARGRLAGFNITVPHKTAIISCLDSISKQAEISRSVNTVSISDGKLAGDSTDGYGLQTAIYENFAVMTEGSSFMLVGAGGSSRAVSFHFLFNGLEKLFIVNRSWDRVSELVRDLRETFGDHKVDFCLLEDDRKMTEFSEASDVIIQTSSLGLRSSDPSPLDRKYFISGKSYYDTIYKNTQFLRYALEKGCRHADGRSMLLHQGVRSFEIWTGITPPVEEMRKVLNELLDKR